MTLKRRNAQELRRKDSDSSSESQALTPEQVATKLQISVKTVLKMANASELPAFRAGRLWRFPCAAIEELARNGRKK